MHQEHSYRVRGHTCGDDTFFLRLGFGSRCLVVLAAAVLFLVSPLNAQGRTVDKQEPATRHLDLPLSQRDSTGVVRKAPLPKIDLPEYTITGKGVIDLLATDKQPAPEDSQSSVVAALLNQSPVRSRATAESSLGAKEDIQGPNEETYSGKVSASLGTFFSPRAGLWFGQTRGDYVYSVDGNYYRTEGFAPYTDRSGGDANLSGSTRLTTYNPYFDQSKISAAMAYRSDTYHWYGAPDPRISRNRTNLGLDAVISNWDRSPIPYTGKLGFQNFQVSDSSTTVAESRFTFGGRTRLLLFAVPLNLGVQGEAGAVSYANSSAGLSLFELSVGSQRYEWNQWSLEGSLHGYLAHGMDHQAIVRLYPHLNAAYQFGDMHTVSVTYAPVIGPASLASKVFANRYVSSFSTIKHTDDQQDVTLAIESSWSAQTRTRFAARVQSMKDYPLYADSLSQGVWQLAYGGRTTITSFSGEVFAKLPSNDYFAAQVVASISDNTVTGSGIPYLPVFEVGASYTRQFFRRWTGIARLTLIHERKDNVVRINTLPSILLIGLRCEYNVIRQATVFVDVRNLLDEEYEYWKGYQEEPFVISGGIALRW